nr:hypothetical protein SHINE37_42736 [Rhizobiaceae bacterium]
MGMPLEGWAGHPSRRPVGAIPLPVSCDIGAAVGEKGAEHAGHGRDHGDRIDIDQQAQHLSGHGDGVCHGGGERRQLRGGEEQRIPEGMDVRLRMVSLQKEKKAARDDVDEEGQREGGAQPVAQVGVRDAAGADQRPDIVNDTTQCAHGWSRLSQGFSGWYGIGEGNATGGGAIWCSWPCTFSLSRLLPRISSCVRTGSRNRAPPGSSSS